MMHYLLINSSLLVLLNVCQGSKFVSNIASLFDVLHGTILLTYLKICLDTGFENNFESSK